MPLAEKTIIAPGGVDAKAPLKRSTVAWVIAGLLITMLAFEYVPRLLWPKTQATDVAKPAATTKTTGSTSQIDAELSGVPKVAARASEPAAPESTASAAQVGASGAMPATAPMPAERRPSRAPEDTRRQDTNVATRSNTRKQQQATEPEVDASIDSGARVSKSVAIDFSGASANAAMAEALGLADAKARSAAPNDAKSEVAPEPLTPVEKMLKAQAAAQKRSDPNREWLREFADLKASSAITAKKNQSGFTLVQGKVIPAVLGKNINSDLPGDITAFTTVDIYDSITSQYLLIPKGSALIGEYSNNIRSGQDRVMFAFSRIILPNGLSFDLPGNKGQDQSGASGITGDVNNHYFGRLASGILIATIADRVEGKSQQPVTNIGVSGPNSAAGKVLADLATEELSRARGIAPTITVPMGTRLNVQVAADMEFPGVYRR
jgi:type IV secretion system protein VirB10